MGVEWAERSEPADAHVGSWPGRRNPHAAADPALSRDARGNADRDTGPGTDQADGRNRPVILTDPEQRVAEYHRYRAIVEGYNEAARAWSEAVPEFRAAWEKIKVKYDYTERIRATPQPADGSWRADGGRRLDAAQNAEVDRGYARIREAGERTIIPALRAVEAEDPTRHLAGFDRRFKGEDRLKEKIADQIRSTPGANLTNEMIPISEEEADQIVARIRRLAESGA